MRVDTEHHARLFEELADGEWHDGPVVLREMTRTVHPGLASRSYRLKDPSKFTSEELMAMAKRTVAREALSQQMGTGRIAVDVEKMSRAHWQGEKPWRIRDTQAGFRTVVHAADELGVTESTLRTWIRNGFVPHSVTNVGIALSPKDFEICQRVRAVWPGLNRTSWPVDPRSLWTDESNAPALLCPHCNGKIAVTLLEA